MESWIFLLLCGFTVSVCGSEECVGQASILLPKVIVPGKISAALVHFHHKDERHNVTLRLIRPEADKLDEYRTRTDILSQNSVTIKGNGVVRLSIPSQNHGIYELQAMLDCTPMDENCTLQTTSKVKLGGSIRDVIIRPTSNYYRPGETINFWILAVDQALHTPNSAMAQLRVNDANGISVGFWDDVPLFQGTKEFALPISERAPLGKWEIVVRTEGATYASQLNVSLARGSNRRPNREQVVTEKHFVELHFSGDMRRKYKPGLPLMGKVEAVSSEEEVRVRVKVIDEQLTILYSQDIDMKGRVGMFLVPAVITNTDEITVQAELISLGGKDVDSQYVLARETLRKWQSESNCYLLIRNLHDELRPDMDAEMTVLTSCANSADMYYVVTTEGKMVSQGVLALSNHTNVSVILDSIMQDVNIYEFNISFAVEAQMAPTSHLFVYYATDLGEIIGDSVTFDVKLLHERVSLIVDENNVYYADDKVKVGILSFPKTHICLVGGMAEETRFGSRFSHVDDSEVFEEGLSFLTSCRVRNDNFQIPTHRSYFPPSLINQLWVWKCFNYTEEVETNGVALPPTNSAGKWKLWALSLSDDVELRVSQPATINVFSPVNVEFELPVAVKVMETVQVEITISSNINSCIDIHALIALSEGAVYPGIDMSIVSEKLRLGGYGATSIVVRIQPVSPGLKTMTANVSSYVRSSCEEAANLAEESDAKAPITSLITRTEKLEAIPEGIEKVRTESAYFCANEGVLSLNGADTRYKYIPAPRKKCNIVFDVNAYKDFRVALTENENSTRNVYRVSLGDYENSVSWIGRGKDVYRAHLSTTKTPNLLSWVESKTFWLSWENAVLSVGVGSTVGKEAFLTHIMDKKMRVNFIGFATGWGVKGRVRISEHNDESGYSQVLRLDVPRNILPGSEKGRLYVTGGSSLPLILENSKFRSNARPFSSLSAVFASFAPILFADEKIWPIEWRPGSFDRSRVKRATEKNIQTLLSYMNEDFSFSDHPKIIDHENTVRVFEILSRAQYLCKIDSKLIAGVKTRIRESQLEDGRFENSGPQTLEQALRITADTVATFVEVGFDEIDERMITKAGNFLRSNAKNVSDAYTVSVVSYALYLLKIPNASDLVDSAVRIPMGAVDDDDDDDDDWQNIPSSVVPSPFDWLYEKDKRPTEDEQLTLTRNYIEDYRASAYILLLHALKKDLKSAEPVVKYIFYRSNILDRYPEKVAYLVTKALCTFYKVSRDAHPSLTISLATSGMELTDTLELKSESSPHVLDLPSLPTKVFIYATGAGCSTVQSRVSFLTYEVAVSYSFDFVTFIDEEIPAHYNVVGDPEGLYPQLVLKSCFRFTRPSKGFRMEGILFSGYKLDSVQSATPEGIDYAYGSVADRLWFTFANVSANCGICVKYLIQSSFVISSLRPMLFRTYEIENPLIIRELFVHSDKKESLLRTDVTDSNFSTWFGSQNAGSNVLDDGSLFYRCGPTTVVDSTASSVAGEVVGDLASRKTVVMDADNAADEWRVSERFASQLRTPTTADIVADSSPTWKANISSTFSAAASSDEANSVGRDQFSSTSRVIVEGERSPSSPTQTQTFAVVKAVGRTIRSGSTNSSEDVSGVTGERGRQNLAPTKRPPVARRPAQAFATTSTSTSTPTPTPTPTSTPTPTVHLSGPRKFTSPRPCPVKAVKRKKVAVGYGTKPKERNSAEKLAPSPSPSRRSTAHSRTASSTPSPGIRLSRSSRLEPRSSASTPSRHLHRMVVGQNELLFDSDDRETGAAASPSSSSKDTARSGSRSNGEKATTVSPLWGMIEEVAYDIERKSIPTS